MKDESPHGPFEVFLTIDGNCNLGVLAADNIVVLPGITDAARAKLQKVLYGAVQIRVAALGAALMHELKADGAELEGGVDNSIAAFLWHVYKAPFGHPWPKKDGDDVCTIPVVLCDTISAPQRAIIRVAIDLVNATA